MKYSIFLSVHLQVGRTVAGVCHRVRAGVNSASLIGKVIFPLGLMLKYSKSAGTPGLLPWGSVGNLPGTS